MANIIGSSLYAYPYKVVEPTIAAGEWWFKETLDLTAAGGGLEQALSFTTPNYSDALGVYVKITVENNRMTYNGESSSYDLAAYANGSWLVNAARLISISADTIVSKEFYNWFIANTYTSPFDMTYTGTYNVREDGVVELLTSGTLVFLSPSVIDVFCVGGGGAGSTPYDSGSYGTGGGGGGYTTTVKKQNVSGSYDIIIGAGGKNASGRYTAAEATTFGSICVANGGANGFYQNSNTTSYDAYDCYGAAGGSGGGGGVSANADYGAGGSDGESGEAGFNSSSRYNVKGGIGQGNTTREFGEPSGKLYAGGGGGGRYMSGTTGSGSIGGSGGGGTGGWHGNSSDRSQAAAAGVANTGGGGGGGAQYNSSSYKVNGASGGSGICCFRAAK